MLNFYVTIRDRIINGEESDVWLPIVMEKTVYGNEDPSVCVEGLKNSMHLWVDKLLSKIEHTVKVHGDIYDSNYIPHGFIMYVVLPQEDERIIIRGSIKTENRDWLC